MRSLVAALRAAPFTFTLYVIQAVLALALSAPISAELTRDARTLGDHALFRAAALEHALTLIPALRVQGRALALGALLLLALTPLLRMAWLSALAAPLGVRRALACGASLYRRALAVSLTLAMLGAIVLAPCLLFAYLVDTLMEPGQNARLHDLLLLGAVASAVPLLFLAHVAHDLAHAFALQLGALRAVRLGVRAALSPRALAFALLTSLLGLAVGAAPLWLASSSNRVGALFASALLQAGCLSALWVRSLWLAYALTCTERHATSRDAP